MDIVALVDKFGFTSVMVIGLGYFVYFVSIFLVYRFKRTISFG